MTQDTNAGLPDIVMEVSELYREEVFTDRKVGTIRVLTPVTAEGETDTSRAVSYSGQTQIMTPAGALPINFEIEAQSIGEAASKFGEAAKQGIQQTLQELEEMRREAASSIVVPGAGGGMGGLGGPGGMPGGGKIQMP